MITPNKNTTEVTVTESGLGTYSQKISVGKHELLADEPITSGGNDTGPNPYDYLLAGLGACTAMTVRAYAKFKQIPLDRITVRLTHEKIYAEDCRDCDTHSVKIDHIQRDIELEGKLSEAERNKLLEIANKCPVHRTLTEKVAITTQLID